VNWLGFLRRTSSRPVGDRSDSSVPAVAAPVPIVALSPEVVRKLLFDAVASGDEARVETLCQEHQELILHHSAAWLDVPAAFRASPEVYEWYGNGLRAVARFCAERLGHRELQDRLMGMPTPSEPPH
jgi:hypothetical protein